MKTRRICVFLLCIFVFLSGCTKGQNESVKAEKDSAKVESSDTNTKQDSSKKKTNTEAITQEDAEKLLKDIDSNISKITPVNSSNTVQSAIDKYSEEYYMFLIDYETGNNQYTSEKMYLINKKDGSAYYTTPNLVLHPLEKAN